MIKSQYYVIFEKQKNKSKALFSYISNFPIDNAYYLIGVDTIQQGIAKINFEKAEFESHGWQVD